MVEAQPHGSRDNLWKGLNPPISHSQSAPGMLFSIEIGTNNASFR